MKFTCNISKKDRVIRIVFGSIFLLATIFYWSKTFFIILSIIMIVEGLIGWCGLASLMDRFKIK